MNKKDILKWIGIFIAALIYSSMAVGLLLAGLRSCIVDSVAAENVSLPAFRGAVVDSTRAKVLGIDECDIEPEADPEPVELPKLYTDNDAVVIAKTIWGEARGVRDSVVTTECQWAAVTWTILNRFDAGYSDTIAGVVTAPNQFHGYKASFPIDDDILELVFDVLERWNAEKLGEEDVGRVLPADYLWFGGDGAHNHFRNEYRGGTRWDWSYGDPYAEV